LIKFNDVIQIGILILRMVHLKLSQRAKKVCHGSVNMLKTVIML